MRRTQGCTIAVAIGCLVFSVSHTAHAEGEGSPNFVPELTLSYTDPVSGEVFECGDGCRRFTVPAGTHLGVRVQIHEQGGDAASGEPAWDLWFNRPDHPYPGLGLVPCYDPSSEAMDRSCWLALQEQVDRESWDHAVPDIACVPGPEAGSCLDNRVEVVMDPDFEGERRPGVYHLAVWVNRFSVIPETNEFDNFVGPIRVTVEPGADWVEAERVVTSNSGRVGDVDVHLEQPEIGGPSSLVVPSTPMPYGIAIVPEEIDTAFNVTSVRSQRVLEFSPGCAGKVNIEVVQTGAYENMVVQVRKVSTGEVMIEATGKGRLRLEGAVDNFDLRDDHAFEVVVTPGQGSRAIRGSMRISYPTRVRYVAP